MIPVTIIGGYLGAGKTTLINKALRNADGRRLAILVNEFGELPIDEDLIEAQDDEIISIAGGCICCSFGSSLMDAMSKMSDLRPAPDHILIESSGVAIPGAIASSLTLLQDFSLNGIIVLADSETVQTNARDKYLSDTILRQIADADLVVLTKSDLIESSAVAKARHWISEISPSATVVTSVQGDIPLDALLGPQQIDQKKFGKADHSEIYTSKVYSCSNIENVPKFADAIIHPGNGVVRAKGFVGDVAGNTALVQIVGRRVSIEKCHTKSAHQIVCIGLRNQIDFARLDAVMARTLP